MNKTAKFTVVIPVHNEEENITPLTQELLQVREGGDPFEAIVVDDHSDDRTPEVLQRSAEQFPWLRVISLRRQSGQSVALHYGVQQAATSLIVTLDGDGQNDPADIPHLVNTYDQQGERRTSTLVNGRRVRREDTWWRIVASRAANSVRRRLLKDDVPDSGCGIKVFSKKLFLSLPFFNHMHRFLPALVRQRGGIVVSVGVNHRARYSGSSHYGTLDRLYAGLIDLIGVLWLGKRAIPMGLEENQNGLR